MVYKVIAISGSLSKTSSNSGLIRACLLVNNPDLQIQVVDISQFQLFNMDIIIEHGFPPQIQAVRDRIAQADAVIFSSPEHNFKISAVMKNAYDWLSFTLNLQVPAPIKQIPAAIITCSLTGGQRAQQHFRRVCQYCKVKVMGKGLQVNKNSQNFDDNGNVISQSLMSQVEQFLKEFTMFLHHNKK